MRINFIFIYSVVLLFFIINNNSYQNVAHAAKYILIREQEDVYYNIADIEIDSRYKRYYIRFEHTETPTTLPLSTSCFVYGVPSTVLCTLRNVYRESSTSILFFLDLQVNPMFDLDFIDLAVTLNSIPYRSNVTRETPGVYANKLFSCIPPPAEITATPTSSKLISGQYSHSIYTFLFGYYSLSSVATKKTAGDVYFVNDLVQFFERAYDNQYYVKIMYDVQVLANLGLPNLFKSELAYQATLTQYQWKNPFESVSYQQSINNGVKIYKASQRLMIADISISTMGQHSIAPVSSTSFGEIVPLHGNSTNLNVLLYFYTSYNVSFWQYPFQNLRIDGTYPALSGASINNFNGEYSTLTKDGVTKVGRVFFSTKGSFKFKAYDSIYYEYTYPIYLEVIQSNVKSYAIPFVAGDKLGSVNIDPYLPDPFTLNLPIGSVLDTIPPVLVNVKFITTPDNKQVLRIQCSDSNAGVAYISLFKSLHDKPFILGSGHLAGGDKYQAIFEFVWEYSRYDLFNLTIVDYALNQLFVDSDTLFYGYDVSTLVHAPYLPSITVAKQFIFAQNNVDVSNQGVSNSLHIEIDSSPSPPFLTDKSLVLEMFFGNKHTLVPGVFDKGMYHFDFFIPAKVKTGYIQYNVYYNGLPWITNENIYAWNEDTQLYVNSTQFDQLFPLVTFISLNQQMVTLTEGVDSVLTWYLEFSDISGFKRATMVIGSIFDQVGFSFNVTGTGKTKETRSVTILMNGSNCRTASYHILSIETEDVLGNIGKTVRWYNDTIHPLVQYDQDEFDFINVACPLTGGLTMSIHPITQKSLDPIDSRSVNRDVSFSFTAVTEFAFSNKHIPYLCLTGFLYQQHCFSCFTFENFGTTRSYQCNTTLPYGFGAGSFTSASVFGVVNDRLFFSSAVNSMAYDTRNITLNQPIIESTSEFNSTGGKLNIVGYGYGLDNQCVVFITFNDGTTKPFTPYLATNNLIYIDGVDATDFNITIQVFHSISTLKSNSFVVQTTYMPTVPPTDTPIVTPSPTPPLVCSSDCGASQNYGKCINGACVCNPSHSGIDCKSKVDDTTVITPDPSKPTVNVTIPGTNSGETPKFTSFVSVVALRELDNSNTPVNNYVFNSNKWILVNEGSSSNDQVTTIQYKYIIEGVNTNITSTVQVFSEATNITFGNQQLFMNPSTIKFTFNITSYPFSKSTNALQLVMTAALESTDSIACSYKEFIDDQSNSQYLKLQIEDRSLFGRFIKFGMIDGRERVVTNTQLDNSYGGKELSKSTSDQSYIGLNIPYYSQYALLDPDFSVLIESNSAGDQENSICSQTSSKKLTNAQIVGIVVGGVVFLFIIAAASFYFYSRKSTSPIALKLRKLGTR